MKLRLLAFLAISIFTTAALNAQLPNGDMEAWEIYSGGAADVEVPEGWETPDMIGADVGADAVVVTKESTVTHGGSFAARLETKTVNVPILGLTFDVPGTLTTGQINFDFDLFVPSVTGGADVSSAYDMFGGYYRYSPAGSDTMNITVLMMLGVDTVGYGNYRDPATTTEYQSFSCPITYFAPVIPDKMQITIVSSGGFTSLEPGSVLYVDDMEVTGGVGVDDWSAYGIKHNIFPNPASDHININNPATNDVMMDVYNLQGQKIESVLLTPDMNTIALDSKYASGIYSFRLIDSGVQVYSGKFKVAK